MPPTLRRGVAGSSLLPLGALALVAALNAGCAHQQLSLSTVLTASSSQAILYQIVLNNIAMFSVEPETLPWHIRLRDGTVQVTDRLGIGQQGGGFSTMDGGRLGIETYGPQGSRQVALQWGTDAVEDPVQVFAMQSAYRRVLGLPPLPPPDYIIQTQRIRQSGGRSDSEEEESDEEGREARPGVSSMEIGFGGEIPIGWFRIGGKKDVPKHAQYVGRYGDRYVWVTPDGIGGLARFSLVILSITKLESTEGSRSGGMMVTP